VATPLDGRLSTVEHTLKDWPPALATRIAVMEALVNERHETAKEELHKALTALDRRLEGMNEFRATLRDQATTLLPRAEWVVSSGTRDRDIQQLRLDLVKLATHTSQSELGAATERESLNRRLELMNEFRAQIKEQTNTYLPRAEADARYEASKGTLVRLELLITSLIARKEIELLMQQVDVRIKLLETKLSNWDGRLWAFGVAFTLLNALVAWGLTTINIGK
jgi:hypothetical protein